MEIESTKKLRQFAKQMVEERDKMEAQAIEEIFGNEDIYSIFFRGNTEIKTSKFSIIDIEEVMNYSEQPEGKNNILFMSRDIYKAYLEDIYDLKKYECVFYSLEQIKVQVTKTMFKKASIYVSNFIPKGTFYLLNKKGFISRENENQEVLPQGIFEIKQQWICIDPQKQYKVQYIADNE